MPPARRTGMSSNPLADLTASGLDTVIPATATATASTPAKPVAANTSGGTKVKIAGYVSPEAADRARDAVAALGSHEDDPASLSEFLEQAIDELYARLQRDRNNGRPFPVRKRRQLVPGRRTS